MMMRRKQRIVPFLKWYNDWVQRKECLETIYRNGLTFSIGIYTGASESSEGQGLGSPVVMKITQPLDICFNFYNIFISTSGM